MPASIARRLHMFVMLIDFQKYSNFGHILFLQFLAIPVPPSVLKLDHNRPRYEANNY